MGQGPTWSPPMTLKGSTGCAGGEHSPSSSKSHRLSSWGASMLWCPQGWSVAIPAHPALLVEQHPTVERYLPVPRRPCPWVLVAPTQPLWTTRGLQEELLEAFIFAPCMATAGLGRAGGQVPAVQPCLCLTRVASALVIHRGS